MVSFLRNGGDTGLEVAWLGGWCRPLGPGDSLDRRSQRGPPALLLGAAGWMNGRMDGWMDTWGGREGEREGWMDGWTEGWMCGQIDVWMHRWMDV